jgi:hypothetical protein
MDNRPKAVIINASDAESGKIVKDIYTEKPASCYKINNRETIVEEIMPLFEQLKKACVLHQIPFFCTALLSDDGNVSQYISELLSPTVADKDISDDRITPLLNVMNGFNTVPPIYESHFDL